MLPVVFQEFEMVYTFLPLFSFQKVNFSKNLGDGGAAAPIQEVNFTRCVCATNKKNVSMNGVTLTMF